MRDEEIALSVSEKTAIDNIFLAEAERVIAEEERAATYNEIKKIYGKNGTITLLSSGWANNRQTVTITGLTDNDLIMFYPLTPEDNDLLSIFNIYCEAEAEMGEIVFHCGTKPSEDITLRYHLNIGLGGDE